MLDSPEPSRENQICITDIFYPLGLQTVLTLRYQLLEKLGRNYMSEPGFHFREH